MVFTFAPAALPDYKQKILALSCALLAGFFAFFFSGDLVVRIAGNISKLRHVMIQATGGIGAFVVVLLWWSSSIAPVKIDETSLDFDKVSASDLPGKFMDAASYLHRFHIQVENVTSATEVAVATSESFYHGTGFKGNVLTQIGKNGPVTFTLRLERPARSVTIVRPELLVATAAGITHPQWSAHGLNEGGGEIAQVEEAEIQQTEAKGNVPARELPLRGPGIVAVRFDSDNHNFDAFSGVLIHELRFQY